MARCAKGDVIFAKKSKGGQLNASQYRPSTRHFVNLNGDANNGCIYLSLSFGYHLYSLDGKGGGMNEQGKHSH